jgi:thioredoxin 1
MKIKNIIAPIVVIVSFVVLVEMRQQKGAGGCGGGSCLHLPAPQTTETESLATASAEVESRSLPLLIDLGSAHCIPCKQMKPTLDDFMANYADRFETRFIDVNLDPEEAKSYGISLIPTQIFFDADGKELYRNEGFMAKEEILAKWAELGVNASNE